MISDAGRAAAPSGPRAVALAEREPHALGIDHVRGARWLHTTLAGKVRIREENAAAALEVVSRFGVDPRWLIYLSPTTAPARTSRVDGFLEHPEEAFEEYAAAGVTRVVCEEKHRGSRAVAVIARDAATATRRFGICDGSTGVVYTRTGRSLFDETAVLVDRVRESVAPLFDSLDTDWLALDCELLPWSAKALALIQDQYAAVAAAARNALPAAAAVFDAVAARGPEVTGADVTELAAATRRRLAHVDAFRDAYAAHCRSADELESIRLAPLQILAAEGCAFALTAPRDWHRSQLDRLLHGGRGFLAATSHRQVDLSSRRQRADATGWWLDLTSGGGEGIVVRPAQVTDSRVQPALKVRGREYLRLVYGPDYTGNLEVLRGRRSSKQRRLAIRQHSLGLDALTSFVAREPLWRTHQAVFAVLALESPPADPRL